VEQPPDHPDFTRADIETQLIEAIRRRPWHTLYRAGELVTQNPDIEPLNWVARLVPDRDERIALLTWARCRAATESARERYRELGWSRPRAERLRRRALGKILDGLRKAELGLDSETNGLGRSPGLQLSEADV
jgi:hypothetical protein